MVLRKGYLKKRSLPTPLPLLGGTAKWARSRPSHGLSALIFPPRMRQFVEFLQETNDQDGNQLARSVF